MNRHGYGQSSPSSPESPKVFFGDSNGRRVNTMGESGRGLYRIGTDKYEKYQPRSGRSTLQQLRRRGTAIRVGGACTALLLVLMWIFPTLRPAALVSLGLFGMGGEEFNIETVRYYDLSNVGGTSRGWEREERILLCAPLRDAAPHLPMFFSHLKNLTYPHNLIDLAFLVGDSKDNTATLLSDLLAELQADKNPKDTFGEISVIEKDFGQVVNQDVESRHGFAAQAGRRKSMAQARNWLLSAALRPTHSWVYWRDVDVETAPFTILEDLMRHNKDIIVPNVWRPLPEWLGGEQPYDLNSWQESETALALADTLDEDAVIVEGYAEYATWRPHLAYLRDPYGDPDMEMEIDGVGGVSILAKAKVFRCGVHFPAFSFEKHAETEGFGKMAKRMQFSVVGLPHYTIWHLYEPSVDDIRHMEELEQERKAREEEERQKRERVEKIQKEFDMESAREHEKDLEGMREIMRESDLKNPRLGAAGVKKEGGNLAVAGEKAPERVVDKKAALAQMQAVGQNERVVDGDDPALAVAAEYMDYLADEAPAAAAVPANPRKNAIADEPETHPEKKASEIRMEKQADGKVHLSDLTLAEMKVVGGEAGAPAADNVAGDGSGDGARVVEKQKSGSANERAAEMRQQKKDAKL